MGGDISVFSNGSCCLRDDENPFFISPNKIKVSCNLTM